MPAERWPSRAPWSVRATQARRTVSSIGARALGRRRPSEATGVPALLTQILAVAADRLPPVVAQDPRQLSHCGLALRGLGGWRRPAPLDAARRGQAVPAALGVERHRREARPAPLAQPVDLADRGDLRGRCAGPGATRRSSVGHAASRRRGLRPLRRPGLRRDRGWRTRPRSGFGSVRTVTNRGAATVAGSRAGALPDGRFGGAAAGGASRFDERSAGAAAESVPADGPPPRPSLLAPSRSRACGPGERCRPPWPAEAVCFPVTARPRRPAAFSCRA